VEGTGEPIYLGFVDALGLYAAIISGTPAQAADQLRDQGALEGALARPRSYADYEDADIALQAAVLAHDIAESQAFIDANKRLALVAMLTFLELNRISSVMRMRLSWPARACRSTSSSDSWGMPTSARPASTCRASTPRRSSRPFIRGERR